MKEAQLLVFCFWVFSFQPKNDLVSTHECNLKELCQEWNASQNASKFQVSSNIFFDQGVHHVDTLPQWPQGDSHLQKMSASCIICSLILMLCFCHWLLQVRPWLPVRLPLHRPTRRRSSWNSCWPACCLAYRCRHSPSVCVRLWPPKTSATTSPCWP